MAKTQEGYNTIVTAIDYTSKSVKAKALKDKTTVGVAEFMYELMCLYGTAII